ncbi:hypothetical protein NUW58_g1527 [Xylaria curta]|uniref:Uncharacterized protein n=1 Tax=Xylaria curta TaxID=42375 RepID=A0ACC1PMD3_9PEZI|nr:hypothetical protein NUW58_g1527 [Xylaria curta]
MEYANAELYVDILHEHVKTNKDSEVENWIESAKCQLDEFKDEISRPFVLDLILHNNTVFPRFPVELLETILSSDPKTILMPYYGHDNFLTELINKNFYHDQVKTTKKEEIVRGIVNFMKRKRETLRSLGEKVSNALKDEDPNDPEEPGTKCIQAAFNFKFSQTRRQGPLPIPIDLLRELVNLATSGMLKGKKEDNGPTPLQRTVDYQLALYDRKGQLDLVRLLLDKCEEAIWDRVAKGTMLALPRGGQKLPSETSVFGWHQFTQAQWQSHIGENIKERNTNSEALSHSLEDAKGRFSAPLRSQSKIEMDKTPSQSPITQKPGLQQKNISSNIQYDKENKKLPSSIENDIGLDVVIKRVTKDGKSGRTGIGNEIINGIDKESTKWPNQFSKITTSSNTNVSEIKLDTVKDANTASKELLKELGLRFLRSTLDGDLEFRRKEFVNGGELGSDGVVTDEDVLEAFFGKQKRKFYFTLDIRKKEGYGTIPKQMIDNFFQRYQYNAVLRHVTLCRVNINFQERGRHINTDQLYFLRWLRGRGVEKILKVTVDDMEKPHRDDEIEEILAGKKAQSSAQSFDVEILDWRKPDLCPEMIQTATPHVRELHLQWSGNNVVLRGWSEPEGLPRLEWLKKIYLYYEVTQATEGRIKKNLSSFEKRIKKSRDQVKESKIAADDAKNANGLLPAIAVILKGTIALDSSISQDRGLAMGTEVEQPWFKNVRDFVDLVPDLPKARGTVSDGIEKPVHTLTDKSVEPYAYSHRVKVALIDDGVDVLESLHMHYSQFLPGRSFDTSQDGPLPEHSSVSGHGNFMAKSILQVCPNALIIPYRLKTVPGVTSLTPQPEPGSAAKAIKQAIDDGADIISMSWSIRLEDESSYKQGLNELRKVVSKARDAKKRIPLMFCAMRDEGAPGAYIEDLPASMEGCKTFRIGAADSTGQAWNQVSYSNVDKESMYLFPGVDIRDVLPLESDEQRPDADKVQRELTDKNGFTGSSIATALAAGLAALLLHCTRLGGEALYPTPLSQRSGAGVCRVSLGGKPAMMDFGAMADTNTNTNTNPNNEDEKKTQTTMEWAREKYNEQYNAWMPWIEDMYLKYFTKDNRTSYVARDSLDKTKVTGVDQVDALQDA